MAFSFLSSLLPPVYADAPAEDKEETQVDAKDSGEEDTEDTEAPAEPEEEEEEEEEPEDIMPALQEECEESAKCKAATEHFRHCEEKVNAGQGYKGEDCTEEFYHMMHCVGGCVAPKLFAKLK